jgi:hypothetical protein
MAVIYPDMENIERLRVSPTPGEWCLVSYLKDHLDDTYEVFFNPYLDGDRPDVIILKEHCAAFIVEVKDWDLRGYRVNEKNRWALSNGSKASPIMSPQAQAFRYKKNLYDLHLSVVGRERLKNRNFFGLVHCYVYLHNADKRMVDSLYSPAEEWHRERQAWLNQALRENRVAFKSYEGERRYLSEQREKLQRDKNMSFGRDRLGQLVKRICEKRAHVLFSEEVYQDFRRRLCPPEHILGQGVSVNFDNKQLALTASKDERCKIKGVAGCGKTSILAQRAVNAAQRHNDVVLVLTFNITLKNYIRDRISDIQGCRDFSAFEISNYHQFFKSQVNNAGLDFGELVGAHGVEAVYSIDPFRDVEVAKYRTILIDEIQDYESAWIKIIRDNFLHEDGEMVLFGDEAQNIYQRDSARSPVVAQGFGRWARLARSYRTRVESPLNQLFKDFQLAFLIGKNADIEITEVGPVQMGLGFGSLRYEGVLRGEWARSAFESMRGYVKSLDLHPNDVVILASRIAVVRRLSDLWMEGEKTHCMCETYEELASCLGVEVDELKTLDEDRINTLMEPFMSEVEALRRSKKNHFHANSGLIKLSTIHSYKGLGSKTVFYLMDEDDDPEIVYTAMTRASENLVVFDIGGKNKCSEFLRGAIG